MPIDKNNNETNFPDIKIIVLGVLLISFIIGGLGYYFISDNQPSEEPTQEVIEEDQKEEIQPEVNNEYIPVIDNLWINIPAFLIITVVSCAIISETICGRIHSKLQEKGFQRLSYFFGLQKNEKNKLFRVQYVVGYTIVHQIVFYIIWFILMLIFAGLSKIWDKEHSWWSNVKKGFFRNRIHRGWLLLIPISIIVILMIFSYKIG